MRVHVDVGLGLLKHVFLRRNLDQLRNNDFVIVEGFVNYFFGIPNIFRLEGVNGNRLNFFLFWLGPLRNYHLTHCILLAVGDGNPHDRQSLPRLVLHLVIFFFGVNWLPLYFLLHGSVGIGEIKATGEFSLDLAGKDVLKGLSFGAALEVVSAIEKIPQSLKLRRIHWMIIYKSAGL